jgi:hypothetical protein
MSDILPQFPHQELTVVTATNDRPDYASLVLLRQEIYANAISIPSIRGRGTDGHLDVVTSDAKYLTITSTIKSLPTNPGPDPSAPLRMATRESPLTAEDYAEARRAHARDLLAYRTYTTVESLLKRQLLQAVPATFVFETMDIELGYSQVSTLALLDHLYITYGSVTADELSKNMENLSRQWDPDQQLEDLWAQIRKCQTFAKDFDPITDKTIVRVTINNLEKSGVFTQALHDWRQRPETEHTIKNMKDAFNLANKDRLRSLNSSSAGFAGKASSNKENQTPPHQLPPVTKPDGPGLGNPMGFHYCWSHGLLISRDNHTSKNCRNRAHGHQEAATALNMMGGNNTIRRKTSQPAVFVTPTPVVPTA